MAKVINFAGQELAKSDWVEEVNAHLIRLEREQELLRSEIEDAFKGVERELDKLSERIKALEKPKRRWRWF